MVERVWVADYDPCWVEQFETERDFIQSTIGPYILAIEHVGSTAVSGLAAKPVIDILVGLRSLADTAALLSPMAALNYEYHPKFEMELPERRYFQKPAGSEKHSHHVHMAETTSHFWQEHILFRNDLRAHPEAAQAYAELKRELAERHGNDRDRYTDAKTGFIEEILRAARNH